jgi:hypothetical protein
MSGYVVKYRVKGFGDEKTSPEYDSLAEAERQADDIRGYEGVEYAVVSENNAASASPTAGA